MKCQQFQDLMDEYLDNELNDARRKEFLRHREDCGTCRRELSNRERLFDRLTSAAGETWTVDLADAVMKKIDREPLPVRRSPMRMPVILAAAGALVTTMIILYLGIAGFPAGISMWDVTRNLGKLIHLPQNLQNSLVEIKVFLESCWVVVRALIYFGRGFFRFLLKLTPFFILPGVILAVSITGYLWVSRHRRRSGMSAHHR